MGLLEQSIVETREAETQILDASREKGCNLTSRFSGSAGKVYNESRDTLDEESQPLFSWSIDTLIPDCLNESMMMSEETAHIIKSSGELLEIADTTPMNLFDFILF